MTACEECWSAAYTRSRMFGGSQADQYEALIAEHGPGRASAHRILGHHTSGHGGICSVCGEIIAAGDPVTVDGGTEMHQECSQ